MKNVLYSGAIGERDADCDGNPFTPHVAVTKEENCYLLWSITLEEGSPIAQILGFDLHQKEGLIERAVEMVLAYRNKAA